jgi:predicted alpha/beta hydrolase family esterase
MPEPGAPKIDAWVLALQQALPNPDRDTILIGHSVGCQTILRYLMKLPNNREVDRAIFIAPWTHLMNLGEASRQIAAPWLETPIEWAAVTPHCSKFIALFSDNDEWVPASDEQIFIERLKANTRTLHQMGHFDAITALPELLEVIDV